MNVTYSADGRNAFYCGYKFRRDPHTGYYLASKKTNANKRERLHEFVWRTCKGDIPKGYQIHHIDGDKSHNDISNLEALSPKDHATKHKAMRTEEQKQAMRENLILNVIPKSKKWHASDQGRQWHSAHAKETSKNRQPQEYKCTYCGESFYSKRIFNDKENRFCCNKCKSTFRRKQGIDDIEKRCEKCGKIYISNKYSQTKFCQSCSSNRRRKNR